MSQSTLEVLSELGFWRENSFLNLSPSLWLSSLLVEFFNLKKERAQRIHSLLFIDTLSVVSLPRSAIALIFNLQLSLSLSLRQQLTNFFKTQAEEVAWDFEENIEDRHCELAGRL